MALFSASSFKIKDPAALGDGCGKCKLRSQCKNAKLPLYGKGERGILLLSEYPTVNEDKSGSYRVEALVAEVLRDNGIDPKTDVWKTSALQCRPKDTTPKELLKHVDFCKGRIWKLIAELQPKVIICFGILPMHTLLADRWHGSGIGSMARWSGYCCPDEKVRAWVCPVQTPQWVNKMGDGVAELVFINDVTNAIKHTQKPFPNWERAEDCVEIITKPEYAINFMEGVRNRITFDYETTGLKPYDTVHRVVSVGIADSANHAVAFELKDKAVLQCYKELMRDKTVGKTAHNAPFEDVWTRVALGYDVVNWEMCTQTSAHILDQRPGTAGLKFQAYVQCGLPDYSSDISSYLACTNPESEAYGDNGYNQIDKIPMKELLKYNAIDALATWRIAEIQCQLLKLDLF